MGVKCIINYGKVFISLKCTRMQLDGNKFIKLHHSIKIISKSNGLVDCRRYFMILLRFIRNYGFATK